MFNRKSTSQVAASSPALIEDLESRKMLAADNIIGIKVAKRVDVNGTALNSNRITIAFNRVVRIADVTKFRSFGYANDLLNPSQQRKVTVNFTVTRDTTGRVLELTTDRLVRKGSRLFIYDGGLVDRKGNKLIYEATTPRTTIAFDVGQNKARFTLSNRTWRPTDLGLFTNDVFSGAPTPTTAGTAPAAATVRANLLAFLNAKVGAANGGITAEKRDSAMGIFDDAGYTAQIPSANLRAALVSLVGTVAEPAIDSYISRGNVTKKPFSTVDFSPNLSASAPVGETKISATGRLYTYIRSQFQGEDFRALSAVLAHEILHQDTAGDSSGSLPSSQDEEIVANAIQATVYVQQAMIDGSFVRNGTKLVNQINDQVLALMNSGDALFPYGGIKQAPHLNSPGNVFVGAKSNPGGFGSTTVKSFEDWIRREYVSRGFNSGGTNTNPASVAILQKTLGATGNYTKFGTTVQEYFDTRNRVLTDVVYIQMATLLKLTF
ncbi:MAG TPA: hypothetical protein VGB55_08760 [Tepidisphaeraceae bacterium]